MRGFKSGLVCLGALLLGACGRGDGGISGKSSKLPPQDFLEAPLSFGDIENTSTCFRTQQLVFQITGRTDGWEWRKIDDAHWDYSVPIASPDGKKGMALLRLVKSGTMVRVIEYLETLDGTEFTHGVGANIGGYVHTFFVTLQQSGAQFIAGCPDPSYSSLRYEPMQ